VWLDLDLDLEGKEWSAPPANAPPPQEALAT
jgi:hypothetical protein